MVAASNTWGLFLLVLMLGYGLVQVPLNIYNHSRTSYMLSHTQFKLSKLYNEKVDIEERLDTLIDELTKYCLQIRSNNPLKPLIERIVKIVPEQYNNRITLTMNDYENNRITTSHLTEIPTENHLIRLHERLKASIHIHHRVQVSWTRMINEAFFLEEILTNEKNTNREYVQQNPIGSSSLRKKFFDGRPKLGKEVKMILFLIVEENILEWYTFCFLRPWTLRLLGITLALISVVVIWSEMTFFSTKTILSVFAKCVDTARNHHQYFTIEVKTTTNCLFNLSLLFRSSVY